MRRERTAVGCRVRPGASLHQGPRPRHPVRVVTQPRRRGKLGTEMLRVRDFRTKL